MFAILIRLAFAKLFSSNPKFALTKRFVSGGHRVVTHLVTPQLKL